MKRAGRAHITHSSTAVCCSSYSATVRGDLLYVGKAKRKLTVRPCAPSLSATDLEQVMMVKSGPLLLVVSENNLQQSG